MKWLLLILFPATACCQIEFDQIVHDFGLIKEDGDKLTHRFHYSNTADQVAEIIYIQPSCGCTVPHFEKRSVYPGEKAWIDIEYDPKNRTGQFLKAVEVGFLFKSDTLKYNIAVKGFALSGNSPVFADDGKTEKYEIRIAPFEAKIRYSDSWNLTNHREFTDFVNDLTFVIDQYNFAQVRVSLKIGENQKINDFESELTQVKSTIQRELVRRNYGHYQVGFITDSITTDKFQHPWLGSVKLSSLEFNDESISTSMIIRKDDKPLTESLSSEEIKRINYARGNVIQYIPLTKKKVGKITRSDNYDKFLAACIRNSLARNEIWIGVTVQEKLPRKKLRKKLLKKISKDLVNSGIPANQINFYPLDTNPKLEEKIILAEYLPFAPEFNTVDSLKIFDLAAYKPNTTWQKGNKSKQNLPAYFQPVNHLIDRIDTTNVYFISMMTTVINEIKSGVKLELLMESSASKSPTRNTDNVYIARIRAEESKESIRMYMLARGLKEEDIVWKETFPLISGPEYDLYHYLPVYYQYFQYLKVIAIYQTETDSIGFIPPYKINFTYQNLEVLNNSLIFQAFVNRLADHINKFGYVEIIIESSASHLPTRKHGSPKHLSYHRAQEAKNSIYEEIQKRGINPSKVIISEERTLVQGPIYENDYEENVEKYEKFQYVKILPGNLLKH